LLVVLENTLAMHGPMEVKNILLRLSSWNCHCITSSPSFSTLSAVRV